MILLFTDFGWRGPYVGQMHAVLSQTAPGVPVIDLMHDASAFQPQAAAYLLAALAPHWPEGAVVTAVVDPGVGSTRRPIAVRAGERWLVGPDNGLLVPAARRLAGSNRAKPEWLEITWQPQALSTSFHGRDLFAPTAARLAQGNLSGLTLLGDAPVGSGWPDEMSAIIYEDAYGNLMTGLTPVVGLRLRAGPQEFRQASTFSDAAPGEAFWYRNSLGLAEIAVNKGSAAAVLGLAPGDPVSWAPRT